MKFEIEIIKTIQSASAPFWDWFFKFISQLGNYFGFAIAFVVIFFLASKKYAVYFSATYLISLLTNWILKAIIARPRPYIACGEIKNVFPGSGNSMPSGHTLSATIISCFCLYLIWTKSKKLWVKIVSTLLFTILVGFVIVSRMYLGQHYLSDTLVAVAIGIIFSTIGILIYKKSEKGGKTNW